MLSFDIFVVQKLVIVFRLKRIKELLSIWFILMLQTRKTDRFDLKKKSTENNSKNNRGRFIKEKIVNHKIWIIISF